MLRDVKPENFLFLTPAADAPLKMIDFGLATYCRWGQGASRAVEWRDRDLREDNVCGHKQKKAALRVGAWQGQPVPVNPQLPMCAQGFGRMDESGGHWEQGLLQDIVRTNFVPCNGNGLLNPRGRRTSALSKDN